MRLVLVVVAVVVVVVVDVVVVVVVLVVVSLLSVHLPFQISNNSTYNPVTKTAPESRRHSKQQAGDCDVTADGCPS